MNSVDKRLAVALDSLVARYPELDGDWDFLERAFEITTYEGRSRASIYAQAREAGSPHGFAAMVALQQCCRVMTDNVFFAGIGTLAKQYEGQEAYLNFITAEAKKRGYKPNMNDYYESQMARFPGDPTAFIPATGGRGHVRKVLESQGRGCRGVMEFESDAGQVAPKPKIRLGEDIIQQNIKRMVAADPDKARKPMQELREEVIAKHGAK